MKNTIITLIKLLTETVLLTIGLAIVYWLAVFIIFFRASTLIPIGWGYLFVIILQCIILIPVVIAMVQRKTAKIYYLGILIALYLVNSGLIFLPFLLPMID